MSNVHKIYQDITREEIKELYKKSTHVPPYEIDRGIMDAQSRNLWNRDSKGNLTSLNIDHYQHLLKEMVNNPVSPKDMEMCNPSGSWEPFEWEKAHKYINEDGYYVGLRKKNQSDVYTFIDSNSLNARLIRWDFKNGYPHVIFPPIQFTAELQPRANLLRRKEDEETIDEFYTEKALKDVEQKIKPRYLTKKEWYDAGYKPHLTDPVLHHHYGVVKGGVV